MTIFIILVCIIALLFLIINLLFAPHNPYQEKYSIFECGFHSFLQTRLPFNITFFIYALIYLLLDLEILLFFPIAVSLSKIGSFGLIIALIFFIILTIGYVIEILAGNLRVSNQSLSRARASQTSEQE